MWQGFISLPKEDEEEARRLGVNLLQPSSAIELAPGYHDWICTMSQETLKRADPYFGRWIWTMDWETASEERK